MKKGVCQCCGADIKTEGDFGTNPGGAKNEEYCIGCFRDGMFTEPYLTMEKQIDISTKYFMSQGLSEEAAQKKAMQHIKGLKRWKAQSN